jgi:Phage integrase family
VWLVKGDSRCPVAPRSTPGPTFASGAGWEGGRRPWLRVFLELGFTYGWREGELLGLRVEQINLADDTIRLAPGTTKNRQGREVVMTLKVRELLRASAQSKRPSDPVLTREGQASDPNRGLSLFRWGVTAPDTQSRTGTVYGSNFSGRFCGTRASIPAVAALTSPALAAPRHLETRGMVPPPVSASAFPAFFFVSCSAMGVVMHILVTLLH